MNAAQQLEFVTKYICSWKVIGIRAAIVGNIDMLNVVATMTDINLDLILFAVKEGHLHVLKWASSKLSNWKNVKIPSVAAENGHKHILEWAYLNGCPWDMTTCYYAAKQGHLECLAYATNYGCSWSNIINDDNSITYMNAMDVINVAVSRGHLNIILWAHQNYPETTKNITVTAALWSQFGILDWVKSLNCYDFSNICYVAINHNKLDVLKWAFTNKVKFTQDMQLRAAIMGHLEIVKFFHQVGYRYPLLASYNELSPVIHKWALENNYE